MLKELRNMINYNTLIYVLKNLHTDITIEKLCNDLDCSFSTCARLLDINKPYKRAPNSLKYETYVNVFQKYKKEYFQDDATKTIKQILFILQSIGINSFLPNTADYIQFIDCLMHQASNFYKDSPNTITTMQSDEIKFQTYIDLKKLGISAYDIAKQLMANDIALYNNLGKHAGTIQQWSDHIIVSPENWGFLCIGKKIIGNWSFIFLTEQQEKTVRTGIFYEEDFTLDKVNDFLGNQEDEAAIYLLNFSLNDGYQTEENKIILWKQFGLRLQQLAKNGIFYKGIYTNVNRKDHKLTLEKMGFQYLIKNQYKGKIYYLNLMNDFPDAFSWIMPDQDLETMYEEYWGTPIIFKQLSHHDVLTKQQLSDISALIWDTDRYIYPIMMSRKQAKCILPLVFATNQDSMFSLNNIFAAIAGNRIIGIILHKKGPLKWSAETLKNMAFFLDETLPDTLNKAEDEYFTSYNNVSDDTTSIINCCIHSNWRLHDIRVGTHMMEAFVKKHSERLELYVLKETLAALRVYTRNGFIINHICNGFSLDNHELPCAFMIRPKRN